MSADIKVTRRGLEEVSKLIFDHSENKLVFTGIGVGDGVLPEGAEVEELGALVHEVHRCPVESFTRGDDGVIDVSARLATDVLDADLVHRETGVFARDGAGEVFLFAYCNVGDAYDYVPAAGSGRAVYKRVRVFLDVGALATTFRDLPCGDLVSFDALNARVDVVIPELVAECFAAAKGEVEGFARDAGEAKRLAEGFASSAGDSAETAQGYAENAGLASEIAVAQARMSENLHDQVVVLEKSATEAAVLSKTTADEAVTSLKNCIKTGQLETATLGGGLTVAGEVISSTPPKSMNSAMRIGDALAESIMPKKLEVQLDVSRLTMIGTGAKNHQFGIDFGTPKQDEVKGVKIHGIYYSQDWRYSALVIEFWQWLGANIYLCARKPALADKVQLNAMTTEHDRLIDGCAQFAFIARADTQAYDLECLSADGTITQNKKIIDYPSHYGYLRLIVAGRPGTTMIDLYMSNNRYASVQSTGLLEGIKKIGEANIDGGDWKVQLLIGFLPGGVLGGAGHAYRNRTPFLTRATWFVGNDVFSKLQNLALL